MLCQDNFASHHTCDHHVGFLFALPSIKKHNKMSHNCLFSSHHNTKSQLSDKVISTHTSVEISIFFFFFFSGGVAMVLQHRNFIQKTCSHEYGFDMP